LPFSYRIPSQNGVSQADVTQYLQFSHLSSVPPIVNILALSVYSRYFHFGEHQLVGVMGMSPVLNLFCKYWLPYFGEFYNSDTRVMSVKVNLSATDILIFLICMILCLLKTDNLELIK